MSFSFLFWVVIRASWNSSFKKFKRFWNSFCKSEKWKQKLQLVYEKEQKQQLTWHQQRKSVSFFFKVVFNKPNKDLCKKYTDPDHSEEKKKWLFSAKNQLLTSNVRSQLFVVFNYNWLRDLCSLQHLLRSNTIPSTRSSVVIQKKNFSFVVCKSALFGIVYSVVFGENLIFCPFETKVLGQKRRRQHC